MVVVDAQGTYKPKSVHSVRPRITLELVWEIACAGSKVPFRLMAPGTVASRLGLGSKRLGDHVNTVVSGQGTKWAERGPGALAALSVVRASDGS